MYVFRLAWVAILNIFVFVCGLPKLTAHSHLFINQYCLAVFLCIFQRNGHIAVQCTELLSFWLCPREFMRVCRGIDNSNVGHKSLSEDYTVCEIRTRLQTNMHPMAVMQDLRSLFHVSIQLYNRSLTLAMDYICTAFSTNGGDGRVLIRVEPSDPLAWIGRYRTLMLESHHASGFRDVIFDSCRLLLGLNKIILHCHYADTWF